MVQVRRRRWSACLGRDSEIERRESLTFFDRDLSFSTQLSENYGLTTAADFVDPDKSNAGAVGAPYELPEDFEGASTIVSDITTQSN